MTQRTHAFTDHEGTEYLIRILEDGSATLAIHHTGEHWQPAIPEDTLEEYIERNVARIISIVEQERS